MDFLIKNRFLEKQKRCETKKYKLFGNDSDIKELEKLMSFYPISKKTKNLGDNRWANAADEGRTCGRRVSQRMKR